MKRVVVIGSANMDVVIRVSHIPASGETILSKGVKKFPGGKGANQAMAATRLGGNVAMVGCVGDDEHGHLLLLSMEAGGINTSAIESLENSHTGTAYIYVSDKGENNIVVDSGANNNVTIEKIARHQHLFEDAAYCLVQLEIPLTSVYYIAELCRQHDVKLIINPAPAAILDFERLKGTWMIVPNENELNTLIPQGDDVSAKAKILVEKGFGHVLVTLGEQGCILTDGCKEVAYPAYTKITVRDTTAAGDSFIGALAFCLSTDMSLEKAINLATKAAAITVSRDGAQQSMPVWEDIKNL